MTAGLHPRQWSLLHAQYSDSTSTGSSVTRNVAPTGPPNSQWTFFDEDDEDDDDDDDDEEDALFGDGEEDDAFFGDEALFGDDVLLVDDGDGDGALFDGMVNKVSTTRLIDFYAYD